MAGRLKPSQENQPTLSLAQVYAALAWYYDRQAAIDAELDRENDRLDELRAAANPSPLAGRALRRRVLRARPL